MRMLKSYLKWDGKAERFHSQSDLHKTIHQKLAALIVQVGLPSLPQNHHPFRLLDFARYHLVNINAGSDRRAVLILAVPRHRVIAGEHFFIN